MQADPEALYRVLCHTYSARAEHRRQAEALLEAADRSPGFPSALLRIAVEPQAEVNVRVAAAVHFKNQVRKWWAPVGDLYGQGYGEADKAAVRDSLLGGVAASGAVQPVRASLVESFRLIALSDFPDVWGDVVDRLLSALRTEDTVQTYCALLLLRRLFKQLEGRPSSRREPLDRLAARALPALRALGPSMVQAASQPGPLCIEAFEMLKLVLKCFYSAIHTAVCEELQRDIEGWMTLLLAVAELPSTPPGAAPLAGSGLEASPAAKCRKWAFHAFLRFCHRHGNRRRCVNGAEAFADAWASAYAVRVGEACLREACATAPGPRRASRRTACLALLCLAEQVAKEATYAELRPRLQQLLEGGIFPWARFGQEDLKLWQEDADEFVRRSFDDSSSFHEPRAAAMEIVERLLRHHQTEVLMPLLQFCKQHLDAHGQNPNDPELCSNKDGALLILGHLGSDLLSLDPARQKKNKGKARASKGVSSTGVSMEDLLANFVKPELTSQVAFLRFRACWVYEKFASKTPRFGPEGSGRDTVAGIFQLTADRELPVRVQACACLGAFFERRHDAEVYRAIVGSLGPLLERLLATIAESQCEEVSATLEALVANYPQEIIPFAAQLVRHLAAQVCHITDAGRGGDADDDDAAEALSMGSMTTILSVLQACVGNSEAKSSEEAQHRAQLFAGIAESLLPLLGRLLHPDGVDLLEEALEILSYLTYYGPTPIPQCLWMVFPRLYQAVCGHPTASLPLPQHLQDGWAPDFMSNLLDPLENFITRGPPEAFMSGVWVEAGLPYPELLFRIFKKILQLTGLGSEKDCAAAAKLPVLFFGSFSAPAADAWLPRYLDELWARLPRAESAALRRGILGAVAAAVWYNAELFLRWAEERRCTQPLMHAWMQNIGLARRLADRKLFLMAFTRLFQLACSQQLPESASGGLPHLVQQLVAQSRELARLRARRDAGGEEDDTDDEGSDECGPGADEDEDSEDDDVGAEEGQATGLALPSRGSPLDRVDEVAALAAALRQAPQPMQQQIQVWVGAPVQKWLGELEAELQRSSSASRASKQ